MKVQKWKWRKNYASEKGRWNKIVKLKGCYSKVSVEVKPGTPHGSLAFCQSRLSKLVQGCLTDWTSLTRFCQHFLDGLVRPCWHYQTTLSLAFPLKRFRYFLLREILQSARHLEKSWSGWSWWSQVPQPTLGNLTGATHPCSRLVLTPTQPQQL